MVERLRLKNDRGPLRLQRRAQGAALGQRIRRAQRARQPGQPGQPGQPARQTQRGASLAVPARGCDGVPPDNVDGYVNSSGFALTGGEQIDYNLWLATQAHARGLSVDLKNDLDQIAALVSAFDRALNEECAAYEECELLMPFIEDGKAVFYVECVDAIAEGPGLADAVCDGAWGSVSRR